MRITPIFAHNPSAWTGAGNHTYLVACAGHAALIDAGTGRVEHLDALDAALGEEACPLETVLVTHAHGDYASGAPALRARHPAAVFAKHRWPGRDERVDVPWAPVADGDVCAVGPLGLVAVHTPGHAPDHLCFFEPSSGVLFGGDLVVNGGTVAVIASAGGDMTQYLASLARVLDLQPRRILPAHGAPIERPAPLLRAYVAHRLMRERQIADALAEGPQTVTSLVARLYDGLDPSLAGAAAESVTAHLVKLERDGAARRGAPDGAGDAWERC